MRTRLLYASLISFGFESILTPSVSYGQAIAHQGRRRARRDRARRPRPWRSSTRRSPARPSIVAPARSRPPKPNLLWRITKIGSQSVTGVDILSWGGPRTESGIAVPTHPDRKRGRPSVPTQCLRSRIDSVGWTFAPRPGIQWRPRPDAPKPSAREPESMPMWRTRGDRGGLEARQAIGRGPRRDWLVILALPAAPQGRGRE